MEHHDIKEPVKIYLDDQEEPFKIEQPPLRFNFSTIQLPDGDHTLRVEASNGLAPPTIKRIPFTVRNGVALTVSGLREGQTIGGQVELIVNAYAGNTEVDFEPRRAETPEPIPTWAWVVFLGILAWTFFYMLNPAQAFDQLNAVRQPEAEVGARLYLDTCARCHGETGEGRWVRSSENPEQRRAIVPPLRDQTNYALAQTPFPLLQKIVLGVKDDDLPMPQWGPILTNEELVAIVNHIRTTWRHDASTITLDHRRPPMAIDALESSLERALLDKDPGILAQCCWPKGARRPILFRTDSTFAKGRKGVAAAWSTYFTDLGPSGKVTQFKLTERRYDYEPATVEQAGSIVIGMGRIFLQARGENGKTVSAKGRFIRVYQKTRSRTDPNDPGFWSLIFDFADIPMRVGCELGYCPPGAGPEGAPSGTAPGATPSGTDPGATPNGTDPDGATPAAAATGGAIGYADVQAMIKALGKGAGDAPHEAFWTLPYDEFVRFEFMESWTDDAKRDNMIRLVRPGDPEHSNLLRAMAGQPVLVTLPDGSEIERASIPQMPKNGKPLDAAALTRLRGWIADGCPEQPGGAPHPTAAEAPPNQPGGVPPAAPVTASVGFADIQGFLAALGKTASTVPHGSFWKELSYDEFVSFRFPRNYGDEAEYRLLIPYDAAHSNLVRVLRDGEGVVRDRPGGAPIVEDLPRMPKNGPALPAAELEQLIEWIDAGCPEQAGQPSRLPRESREPPEPKPAGPGALPVPKGPAPGGGFPVPKGDK